MRYFLIFLFILIMAAGITACMIKYRDVPRIDPPYTKKDDTVLYRGNWYRIQITKLK